MKNKKELYIVIMIFSISIPTIVNIRNKMEDTASKNLINATYIVEKACQMLDEMQQKDIAANTAIYE